MQWVSGVKPVVQYLIFSNSTLKFDQNGELVISKLNVEFVQKLADQSNGKFMRIDSAYPNLSLLLTEINLRSKGYFRNLKVEVKQSLVDYPVYFGFVFYVILNCTDAQAFTK